MSQAAFLLKQDARENRPWRLYVNGQQLTQANGTNPRISQVSPTEALTISATSDRVIELLYKARVVKQGIDPALMLPTNRWQISFDGGVTLFDCRVQAPIREKGTQGVAWLVFLERGNRSTGVDSVAENAVLFEGVSDGV